MGKSSVKDFKARQPDVRQYADEHNNDQAKFVTTSFTRRSALKFDEEEELVGGLKELLKYENELEEAKITLTACPDFNLMDAF